MPSKLKPPTMKQLRLLRCWTQQQLADKAEVGVATIVRCEKGAGRWPQSKAVKKAVQMALGVQS